MAPLSHYPLSPTGPIIPTKGALFGAYVPVEDHNGPDRQTALLNFEALVGRKLDLDKEAYAWDTPFPGDTEAWSRDQGRTLVFDWESVKEDGTLLMWSDIAAGVYDADIDAKAESIKAFGAPAFMIFNHEPEGGVPFQGTAQDFINAYRHVHDRLQADGVTNLSYVLDLLAWTFKLGNQDQYWPGGRYVDLMGADGYNWYGCPWRHDPWTSFSDVFIDFYNDGLTRGKSMMLGEWASTEDYSTPGRKAQWFTDASATLKTWPEVKALAYYENGPPAHSCEWWVDTSDSALASFSAIGADPYFNPPPPLVSVTSGPPDPDNSSTATFAFTVSEPSLTVCALDSGDAVPCKSGYTLTGLVDGAHTLRITATDGQGFTGYTTYDWSVDTVPPVLTIASGPPTYTKLTSATFNLVSTEPPPYGYFTCQLDGGAPVDCGSWITYEGLTDGLHTFLGQAFDGAGNASDPVAWPFTVDTVPPTVAIVSGPPPLSNTRSATFTFSSNELGATYKCSLDGGSYVGCQNPKTFNSLQDGQHTVGVEAVDLAGNLSSPATWSWTIDATAPVTTITSGPSDGTQTRVTFTFTASESPVTFTCSLDGSLGTICISPTTYRNIQVGNHTFTVYATDLAGNVGNTAAWRWTRTG